MKRELCTILLVISTAFGRPAYVSHNRREVPQEHSHEQFLTTVNTFLKQNNPDGIVDAVFGLLGNMAGKGGQGGVPDTDCLQQATADRAFSNAKAASDVNGMVAALVYRALERNTGAVGLASTTCATIKAVNSEVAAISQHQDPAAQNAAQISKAITTELARQIAAVGGDPQVALIAGTFAPGKAGDPTAVGNTCDDANDNTGCIFTRNLLVEDASPEEIKAAVSGSDNPSTGTSLVNTPSSTSEANQQDTVTVTVIQAPTTVTVSTCSQLAVATNVSSDISAGESQLDFGSCANPTIVFGAGFDG